MSGLEKFHLPFTDEEAELVARIDFGEAGARGTDRHAAYLSNKEPILALLASLGERGAVPEARLAYWNDPECNPGRPRGSRKEMFERNGSRGEDAYTNPNFVKHLRYILFGADLPSAVMLEFEEEVGNPEWVSYGDALELGKFARGLVRRHRLNPSSVCDEFLKLSLDLRLSVDESVRIRQIVRETR